MSDCLQLYHLSNILGYFVAATESPCDKINCDTGVAVYSVAVKFCRSDKISLKIVSLGDTIYREISSLL